MTATVYFLVSRFNSLDDFGFSVVLYPASWALEIAVDPGLKTFGTLYRCPCRFQVPFNLNKLGLQFWKTLLMRFCLIARALYQ